LVLDPARYLLGVAELVWLAGFSALGAAAVRQRLLPAFSGAPACLASAVIALALLIWTAEILGSFGLFEAVPYLVAIALVGLGAWLGVGGRQEGPPYHPPVAQTLSGQGGWLITLAALAIAAAAVVKFGVDVRSKLLTGMTGFDSTWYHGPFAAGFFQSGDTWSLHFIAPQFLAWFYPANAEIFHAAGMLAFGRDLLSPLLNLGWFVGCLVACWCIGRPYRVGPCSLALGAIALSLPVLSDQAGEARNDIVGIFFLLAAVAIILNGRHGRGGVNGGNFSTIGSPPHHEVAGGGASAWGTWLVAGLAAGLAAGTKLNFLLPAAVLVLGLAFLAPAGRRWRALIAAALAALAGGGYWYLRNLVHTGNPLPWFDHLGPISLPAPDQALGGREGHSVLGYLTDGSVWSDWFLPGLHGGLTILWPLLLALAFAGLIACILPPFRCAFPSNGPRKEQRSKIKALRCSLSASSQEKEQRRGGVGGYGPVLWIAGLTGLAAAFAWLIAPASASGPGGVARGFESGLRYLAPALVLGLTVLPLALLPRVARWRGSPIAEDSEGVRAHGGGRRDRTRWLGLSGDRTHGLTAVAVLLTAIAIGYPIQRHYLQNRYANPTFAAPGLNATFKWANGIADARIATTSTRQYPLYGTDLSNHVQYVGEPQSHGGFTAPTTCQQWRRLLNEGHYDYIVTTRDRIETGKPTYPQSTRWTEGPEATPILHTPPTVVFKLRSPLDPSACRD
jgi:hypothetical protein